MVDAANAIARPPKVVQRRSRGIWPATRAAEATTSSKKITSAKPATAMLQQARALAAACHAESDAPPTFLPARPGFAADLATLTERVRRRVIRWFRLARLLDNERHVQERRSLQHDLISAPVQLVSSGRACSSSSP